MNVPPLMFNVEMYVPTSVVPAEPTTPLPAWPLELPPMNVPPVICAEEETKTALPLPTP